MRELDSSLIESSLVLAVVEFGGSVGINRRCLGLVAFSFSSGSLLSLLVGSSLGVLAHLLLLILADDGISAVALDARLNSLLFLLHSLLLVGVNVALVVTVSNATTLVLFLALSGSDAEFSIPPILTRDDLRSRHFRDYSRSWSAEVAGSPVREAFIGTCSGALLGSGGVGISSLGLLVDGLNFVLGSGCLGVAHRLVVLLICGIKLSRTGVRGCTSHLLPHGLLEAASSLIRHLEGSLGLLSFLSCSFTGHDVDAGLPECSLNIWLPLGIVELFKHLWLSQKLLSATIEDVNLIVHFDALV